MTRQDREPAGKGDAVVGEAPSGGPSQEDREPEQPGLLSAARKTLRLPEPTRLTRQAKVTAKQALRRQVPGGARYAFRVDLTAMLLAGLYTGAVFPFVNVIARDKLNATPEILAFIAAAPFLGNLMTLFWARAMEGKRKVPFVKWSHLGARLCILLSLFAVGAWPFALVVSCAQIIGSIAGPAYAAIIKAVYPESQRGRLLGLTRMSIVVAQVFATLLVGWLLTFTTYQYIFPVAALIGMASALVFSRIQPDEQPHETDASRPPENASLLAKLKDTGRFIGSTLGILKTDRAYRWFAFSVFTYGFGNLVNTPIIPLIQVDELHVREWEVSVLTVAMQLVMVVAFVYWGRYVDQKGPQRAVVVNILLNSLIPVFYILAGTLLPASPWVLFPAYIVTGIVGAGIDLSYFNAILTFSGDQDVSRYQAIHSFLLGIRGTIAPFVGGALVRLLTMNHLNLRWAFVLSLVCILIGSWMQIVAIRKQQAQA